MKEDDEDRVAANFVAFLHGPWGVGYVVFAVVGIIVLQKVVWPDSPSGSKGYVGFFFMLGAVYYGIYRWIVRRYQRRSLPTSRKEL